MNKYSVPDKAGLQERSFGDTPRNRPEPWSGHNDDLTGRGRESVPPGPTYPPYPQQSTFKTPLAPSLMYSTPAAPQGRLVPHPAPVKTREFAPARDSEDPESKKELFKRTPGAIRQWANIPSNTYKN